MLGGSVGLVSTKWKRDSAMQDEQHFGMDVAFLAMPLMTNPTGGASPAWRKTATMGLLPLKSGAVSSWVIAMP